MSEMRFKTANFFNHIFIESDALKNSHVCSMMILKLGSITPTANLPTTCTVYFVTRTQLLFFQTFSGTVLRVFVQFASISKWLLQAPRKFPSPCCHGIYSSKLFDQRKTSGTKSRGDMIWGTENTSTLLSMMSCPWRAL